MAFNLFEEGQDEAARRAFSDFEPRWNDFVKTNSTYWDKDVLYKLAVCEYSRGRYANAESLLRTVIKGASVPRPAAVGYYKLVVHRQGGFGTVVTPSLRLEYVFPVGMNRRKEPEFMFAVADSYLHLGCVTNAIIMFGQIVTAMQDAEWVSKAQTRLRQCEEAKNLLEGSFESAKKAMDYLAEANAWDLFPLVLKHESTAIKKEAATRLGNVSDLKSAPALLLALKELRVMTESGKIPACHNEFVKCVLRSLERITGVRVPHGDMQSSISIQSAIDVYERTFLPEQDGAGNSGAPLGMQNKD